MAAKIPKEALPVVKESVRREAAILNSKIKLIKKEISDLEKKHRISSKEFKKRFDKGELGDSQEYFEWWGLLRGLEKLKQKLKVTKSVISSW